METRNRNTLKSLIWKRVGVIRTGRGKAMLVGYVTIREVIKYEDVDSFRADYVKHRVPQGSRYDIKGIKYGYVLDAPERCDPVEVTSRGIVIRNI